MAASKISAILFDKDGTLFDFAATWRHVVEGVLDQLAPDRETWTTMARAGGYDPVRGSFQPGSLIVAGSNGQIAQLWADFRPDLGVARVERILDDASLGALTDPEAIFPTVPDLGGFLGGLRAGGLMLGIATHDSEEGARVQLRVAKAVEAFDFIAGYDSGHGLKPGPGMLLAFAKAIGVPPDHIAMVGDSRHDLETGLNGGAALTIGVLTGPATREDLAPYASHILPSIGGLPQLIAGLGR